MARALNKAKNVNQFNTMHTQCRKKGFEMNE